MRSLFFASTLILLASLVTGPNAYAKDTSNELTPFNLVNLAYNGYFHDQGISNGGQLASDYLQGRVSAEELIQAAINNNRLDAEALEDTSYIRAVKHSLRNLVRD
jgi:hypothetical protein